MGKFAFGQTLGNGRYLLPFPELRGEKQQDCKEFESPEKHEEGAEPFQGGRQEGAAAAAEFGQCRSCVADAAHAVAECAHKAVSALQENKCGNKGGYDMDEQEDDHGEHRLGSNRLPSYAKGQDGIWVDNAAELIAYGPRQNEKAYALGTAAGRAR